MVFQLPAGSFDPHMPLGESVGESLLNNGVEKDERKKRVIEMFREYGLSSDFYTKYPHEVSGGECQRAAIARALIVQPEILICDEVTSSLDVTMQKQIMDLLRHLKETNRLSILFISHNPALVQFFCDRVIVLKDGRIQEEGPTEKVFFSPQSSYKKNCWMRLCGMISPGFERGRLWK